MIIEIKIVEQKNKSADVSFFFFFVSVGQLK